VQVEPAVPFEGLGAVHTFGQAGLAVLPESSDGS